MKKNGFVAFAATLVLIASLFTSCMSTEVAQYGVESKAINKSNGKDIPCMGKKCGVSEDKNERK